jgi:hypothetical protein
MATPPTASAAAPAAFRWIKTDCGRAKYLDLSQREGVPARLRLGWFVLIAGLRDWRLADPDQPPRPQDSSPADGS